jgi:hypothetical protein
VPEQDHRKTGELAHFSLYEQPQVLEDAVPPVAIAEVSEILFASGGPAVPPMVVSEDGVAVAGKVRREFRVSSRMFGHPMGYVNHRERGGIRQPSIDK